MGVLMVWWLMIGVMVSNWDGRWCWWWWVLVVDVGCWCGEVDCSTNQPQTNINYQMDITPSLPNPAPPKSSPIITNHNGNRHGRSKRMWEMGRKEVKMRTKTVTILDQKNWPFWSIFLPNLEPFRPHIISSQPQPALPFGPNPSPFTSQVDWMTRRAVRGKFGQFGSWGASPSYDWHFPSPSLPATVASSGLVGRIGIGY